jgi:hypothetical protein
MCQGSVNIQLGLWVAMEVSVELSAFDRITHLIYARREGVTNHVRQGGLHRRHRRVD